MKKNVIYLFFSLIAVVVFSFQVKSQTIFVKGSIKKETVKLGKIGKGTIILSIPQELHVNSNTPTTEFMIPTKVELKSGEVKIENIIYPKGKNRKFDFSETPINIYDGEVKIEFSFRVPKKPKTKNIKINAVIKYQACTDEVCYQPQKEELILETQIN